MKMRSLLRDKSKRGDLNKIYKSKDTLIFNYY